MVNFMDFNEIGPKITSDANSFKKIQYFSKTNPTKLFNINSDFNSRYLKISNLYLNDGSPSDSYIYGTYRQHNYLSPKSLTNNFNTKIDNLSVNKFMDYNHNIGVKDDKYINDLSQPSLPNSNLGAINTSKLNEIYSILGYKDNILKGNILNYFFKIKLINNENDQKQYNNVWKYILNTKITKKKFIRERSSFTIPG